MEILIWLMFIGFLSFMYFESKQRQEEKIVLIRELSIALKTETVEKYTEALPYYWKEEKIIEPDELVPIESIEPDVLLRSLK